MVWRQTGDKQLPEAWMFMDTKYLWLVGPMLEDCGISNESSMFVKEKKKIVPEVIVYSAVPL